MKKFRIIEIRCTENGENFVVETTVKAESEKALREFIDKEKPSSIKDKNYRIKEITSR